MSLSVCFQPLNCKIKVEEGTTVVEAARKAGIPLNTLCIGNGACGKCLIICHSQEGLSPVTCNEQLRLGKEMLAKGYRLGCLSRVYSDIEVTLPPQTLRAWTPLVKKTANTLDAQRYRRGPRAQQGEPGLGIALDLGTTTLTGCLHDLQTEELLATVSVLNPQVFYGADVVTRLSYAAQDRRCYQDLRHVLLNGVNQIMEAFSHEVQSRKKEIKKITVVGNSFIHHSFLGLDLETFRNYPYKPLMTEDLKLKAAQIGRSELVIPQDAYLEMLPLVDGFVGSDLLAGMQAVGIDLLDVPFVYLDLGTNNEVAVGNGHEILVASTCAGPAFEGGALSCGMRAQPGAIDAVKIEKGRATVDTIDHLYPLGICGSGSISLLAEMLKEGIVNERGRIKQANGLINGREAYLVVEGESPLGFTNQDVEEIQKAKAAVFAAIIILSAELGITFGEIKHVYIAGAFGFHLRIEDAIMIGLLPRLNSQERFQWVGNAAADGARLALLYDEVQQDLAGLLRKIKHINLADHPRFNEEFIKAMFLPHEDEALFRGG